MVVINTTGYFIAILGSYIANAKNNDGSIQNHALAFIVLDIKNWIEKEDIFIVDIDFRDSLDIWKTLELSQRCPPLYQRDKPI